MKDLSQVLHFTFLFPFFESVWTVGSDSSRHLLADAFLDSVKTFVTWSMIGLTIGEYVKLGGGVTLIFDASVSSLARVELWGFVMSFSELVSSFKFSSSAAVESRSL